MPTVIARIVAAALLIAAFCASGEATAFGLRLGPFHLSLPGRYHHSYYHSRRMVRSEPSARLARTEPAEASGPAAATDGAAPALLYPVLAWPALYDNIFWPRDAEPWTFGYENIFTEAFAKYSPQRASAFCPYRIASENIVMRIARETMPTTAQQSLLHDLGTALGQANGYLIKSCPSEIPSQPVARLQLMENQIDAMIMALDIVRPRLQAFEQSLDDKQRAALDGPPPAGGAAPPCRLNAGAVDGPLSRLEQAVQPTDAQHAALAAVGDAFNRAAANLEAACSTVMPPTALGRLEAIETRLDASWQAVLTIRVALANFQTQLSDQQRDRFDAIEMAAAH